MDRGLGWCSVRELDWLLVFAEEGDPVVEGAGDGRLNHVVVGCGACWLTPDVLMSCWIAAGSATVHWVRALAASVIARVVVKSPSETSLGCANGAAMPRADLASSRTSSMK